MSKPFKKAKEVQKLEGSSRGEYRGKKRESHGSDKGRSGGRFSLWDVEMIVGNTKVKKKGYRGKGEEYEEKGDTEPQGRTT